MEIAKIVLQLIIGLGILNVWILRYGKSTSWRGGEARNMEEEFRVYGLPAGSVKVIGALKILFAVLLIAGIWFPAVGLGVLMLGAVAMHVKVKDPLQKSLPAFSLLVFCAVVALV